MAYSKSVAGYGASSLRKAAVRSFVRIRTAELKDHRIRVNCISPHPTDTLIMDSQVKTKEDGDKVHSKLAASIPFGRLAAPRGIRIGSTLSCFRRGELHRRRRSPVDGGVTTI
ncbi:SDR family oxidoreductase [Paraburkholderia caribensis]|uniref:SDR family oxidoreductase n=1 Tax=Paraburkholderia TaxID=1822464 RepID=UPI001CB20A8C|nr:hypothetical protein PCAR4_570127 [Paraburkholderia caribensis]